MKAIPPNILRSVRPARIASWARTRSASCSSYGHARVTASRTPVICSLATPCESPASSVPRIARSCARLPRPAPIGGRAHRRRRRCRPDADARASPATWSRRRRSRRSASQGPVQAASTVIVGRDQQAPLAGRRRAVPGVPDAPSAGERPARCREREPIRDLPGAKSSASSAAVVDLRRVDRAVGDLAAVDRALDDLLAHHRVGGQLARAHRPAADVARRRSRRRRSSPSPPSPRAASTCSPRRPAIALPLTAPLAMSLDLPPPCPGGRARCRSGRRTARGSRRRATGGGGEAARR